MAEGSIKPALVQLEPGVGAGELRRLKEQVDELQKRVQVLDRSVGFFSSHIGKINQIEAYFDILEKSAAQNADVLDLQAPSRSGEDKPPGGGTRTGNTAVERFFYALAQQAAGGLLSASQRTAAGAAASASPALQLGVYDRNPLQSSEMVTPSNLVRSSIFENTPIRPQTGTRPVDSAKLLGSNLATSQSIPPGTNNSATSSDGGPAEAPPLYEGSFADNLGLAAIQPGVGGGRGAAAGGTSRAGQGMGLGLGTTSDLLFDAASSAAGYTATLDGTTRNFSSVVETTSAERRYRALAAATAGGGALHNDSIVVQRAAASGGGSSHLAGSFQIAAPPDRGNMGSQIAARVSFGRNAPTTEAGVPSDPRTATAAPTSTGIAFPAGRTSEAEELSQYSPSVRSSPSGSGRGASVNIPQNNITSVEYFERPSNVPQTTPKFQPSPQVLRQQQQRLLGEQQQVVSGGVAPVPGVAVPWFPSSEPAGARVSSSGSMRLARLGNGSWAAAYKTADAKKREKLELLYKTGIVSAKELEEDNTTISEEHIRDCVGIADEMLRRSPCDVWTKQPELAQSFFEHELTKLYTRKFGTK